MNKEESAKSLSADHQVIKYLPYAGDFIMSHECLFRRTLIKRKIPKMRTVPTGLSQALAQFQNNLRSHIHIFFPSQLHVHGLDMFVQQHFLTFQPQSRNVQTFKTLYSTSSSDYKIQTRERVSTLLMLDFSPISCPNLGSFYNFHSFYNICKTTNVKIGFEQKYF